LDPREVKSGAVDLYEYEGKALFRRFGLPAPQGRLVENARDAAAAADDLGGPVVVKAQVLTGGRGKAGGIAVARSADEATAAAERILSLTIGDHPVERVLVEPAAAIDQELYLSVTVDRGARRPLLMFSAEGGVDIEALAVEHPEKLVRVHADPLDGYSPSAGAELLAGIEDLSLREKLADVVERLYECFVGSDALLCEVNPLVVTEAGDVVALDAKVTIDDSALYRQPELSGLAGSVPTDPIEAFAREQGVTYVRLDGTVGILGNGAGLAMSTVDVVVVEGGEPANFCDLGGGGSAEGVVSALEVITRDERVRSILFNIFGGITRCDQVAHGILTAVETLGLTMPIVVRLDGTNAAEGRRILSEAGNPAIVVATTMLDAARQAVELAR